jgi:hypothetical protein
MVDVCGIEREKIKQLSQRFDNLYVNVSPDSVLLGWKEALTDGFL